MVIYAAQPTPAVLERTVAHRSLATRPVITYLYSMPSAAPHNNILWLYRRGKDRALQVEFFSKVHVLHASLFEATYFGISGSTSILNVLFQTAVAN